MMAQENNSVNKQSSFHTASFETPLKGHTYFAEVNIFPYVPSHILRCCMYSAELPFHLEWTGSALYCFLYSISCVAVEMAYSRRMEKMALSSSLKRSVKYDLNEL